VACKPCAGKLEYMDLNMHARTQCKLCPAGLVPNTERTECGEHPMPVSDLTSQTACSARNVVHLEDICEGLCWVLAKQSCAGCDGTHLSSAAGCADTHLSSAAGCADDRVMQDSNPCVYASRQSNQLRNHLIHCRKHIHHP
jgi:hypothetical protein